MCFTDFPTETFDEAMETLRFIGRNRERLSLFICGVFELVGGSPVARDPAAFGIGKIWHEEGDRLKTGLYFEPRCRGKPRGEGTDRRGDRPAFPVLEALPLSLGGIPFHGPHPPWV